MSGVYTIPFSGVAMTVQQDLIEVTAHSTKQCVLLGWGMSQTTELGDAQEEQLLLLVKSGQTTSGSGGSSVTPAPLDPVGAVAAGFVAEANNTTKASAGTITTHYPYGWNVRMEKEVILPESMQVIFGAGRRLTIELASTPADSITANGYAVVQEIG